MASSKKSAALLAVAAALVVLAIAVYAQLRGHAAIHFDDDAYVTDNYVVQRGITRDGLAWSFTIDRWANLHPVTWWSHMLDCQLFGLDMGLHHMTSLALHIANTLLLLWLLYRMTGDVWRPAFVAALFALHPLNVETVAWIAERKNVLSTFFWLLATLAYVAWVERPSIWRYALILLALALGLMAKPMLVTLPFTLLLFDYWPLGRTIPLRRLVLEKAPIFALAAASSIVTFALHRDLAAAASAQYPLATRVANSIASYGAYLMQAIWPHDLAIVYPLGASIEVRSVALGVVLLAAITWLAVRTHRRQPYLGVGWLWFLGTLVPVIGIVQVGGHTMADRYAYVSLIGVFVMIAWGLGAMVERWPSAKNAAIASASTALLALGVISWKQAARWKDSVTLFEHTLAVTENNGVIQGALGVALAELGRPADALPHLLEARRLMPGSADVLNDLGSAYANLNRPEDAMECFRTALAMRPDSPETHTILAFTLVGRGRTDEALEHYREALRLRPDYPEVHLGLAALYESQHKNREAIDHYREALRLKPGSIEAHTNVGALLATQGDYAEAIEHFRAVLSLDPRRLAARNNLGYALAAQGKIDEAAAQFRESLAIEPNQPAIRSQLASMKKP